MRNSAITFLVLFYLSNLATSQVSFSATDFRIDFVTHTSLNTKGFALSSSKGGTLLIGFDFNGNQFFASTENFNPIFFVVTETNPSPNGFNLTSIQLVNIDSVVGAEVEIIATKKLDGRRISGKIQLLTTSLNPSTNFSSDFLQLAQFEIHSTDPQIDIGISEFVCNGSLGLNGISGVPLPDSPPPIGTTQGNVYTRLTAV
jgi:hypothetical protein